MADATRSVWNKPQLIAVARNRPEESLMIGCKTNGSGGGGFDASNTSCAYGIGYCDNCSALVSS